MRPEIEEIEEAYKRVTEKDLERMYKELRELYDVDETVTNEHLTMSAKLAIAYEEIIRKYKLSGFGYYWWGEKEFITDLRSQSAVAVSRLPSMGCPGVTECDIKTAMAMKIVDLMGGGGMFLEFFSMDFDENFLLMGHDGPSNIAVREENARLTHLDVHHGKSGRGLGIDFNVKQGTVTLLNLTRDIKGTFKLLYTIGEVIPGDILAIGNPNCRVKIDAPIDEFIDAWCQHGPTHHSALGIDDFSGEIEMFGEAMNFPVYRF